MVIGVRLRSPYVPAIVSVSGTRLLPEPVDAILARDPTCDEVAAIGRISISFDSEPGVAGRSIVDVLRCASAIEFDSPLPLIGETNVVEWLRRHEIGIHVFDGPGYSSSGNPILLRRETLERDGMLVWDDGHGAGLVNLLEIIVHEAHHEVSGSAHDCADSHGTIGLDSSLDLGGAWAAQYWFDRWLAEHSGQSLSEAQRLSAAMLAEELRTDGSLSCGVPIGPAPWYVEPVHRQVHRGPDDSPTFRRCLKQATC